MKRLVFLYSLLTLSLTVWSQDFSTWYKPVNVVGFGDTSFRVDVKDAENDDIAILFYSFSTDRVIYMIMGIEKEKYWMEQKTPGLGRTVFFASDDSIFVYKILHLDENKKEPILIKSLSPGMYEIPVILDGNVLSSNKTFYQIVDEQQFNNYMDNRDDKKVVEKPQEPQQQTQSDWTKQEVTVSKDVTEEPGRYSEIKVGMLRSQLVNYGVNTSRYKSKVYKNSQGTYEILSPILSFDMDDPMAKAMLQSMPGLAADADAAILKERPYITIVNGKVTALEYKQY